MDTLLKDFVHAVRPLHKSPTFAVTAIITIATYVAIALLFVTIAALASWLPARRAARLNPVVALRDE